MKSFAATLALILIVANHQVAGFGGSFAGSKLSTSVVNSGSISMEYIPNGMSKEQWQKVKDAEKKKLQGKNLGKTGITTFQSRTFAEWQKAGGKNLFPVDPKSVKDPKDIPYMQRPGGKPDNSDLKAKKSPLDSIFKKKPPAKAPEPEKKGTNWWTL